MLCCKPFLPQEWRLLDAREEAQEFGQLRGVKEVRDRSAKPALQFADIATLSRKRITSPDKVRSGLDTWATSVTASFKAALEEWPREVPDPVNELGCLWRLAKEDSDCRRMLRAKLGFACVLSLDRGQEQPAMLPWHVGLACAMSYFPKEFPSLPMWARRAVLHKLTESTRDSISRFLSDKYLVPCLEDDCRQEVRPAESESQEWQALKRFRDTRIAEILQGGKALDG